MDSVAYYNGSWMRFDEVRIDPVDRGFLAGDTVFDAARTFDGNGFLLQAHIDRLYDSLASARISPPVGPAELLQLTEELIRRNDHLRATVGDLQVWQWVSRGRGRWASTAGPPALCLFVLPVDFAKFAALYESGAHAIVTGVQSLHSAIVDPRLKTFSRMHFNLAELEASRVDPEGWAVLVDGAGNVTEGSGYNLFVVRHGRVVTPAARSVLAGVSRGYALQLLDRLGIEAVETLVQPFDLHTADEAFFTGTSPCAVPVTRADGITLGDGAPGPVTVRLLEAWSEDVGLDIPAQARKFATY